MPDFPIKRTPEQGHTRACLAHAISQSLAGWIEAHDIDDLDFRQAAQDNAWLTEADEWLATGTVECQCPDHTVAVGPDWFSDPTDSGDLRARAACTCGWSSNGHEYRSDAVNAADGHAHGATSRGERVVVVTDKHRPIKRG